MTLRSGPGLRAVQRFLSGDGSADSAAVHYAMYTACEEMQFHGNLLSLSQQWLVLLPCPDDCTDSEFSSSLPQKWLWPWGTKTSFVICTAPTCSRFDFVFCCSEPRLSVLRQKPMERGPVQQGGGSPKTGGPTARPPVRLPASLHGIARERLVSAHEAPSHARMPEVRLGPITHFLFISLAHRISLALPRA